MVWPFYPGIIIRVWRRGCVNRPFYLIGVSPTRRRPNQPPGTPYLDEVFGCWDPMPNEKGEIIASIDLKRLVYYMGKGAYLGRKVQEILGLAGFMPIPLRLYAKGWETRQKMMKELEEKSKEISEQKEESVN